MIERRDGFSHRQPEHIFSNYSSYRQRLLVLQYEQHMSVIKVWVKANGSCVQVTHVTYMNKDCLCPHIVFLQTSLMGIFYSSEWINYQIIKHLTKCGAFIWQSPIPYSLTNPYFWHAPGQCLFELLPGESACINEVRDYSGSRYTTPPNGSGMKCSREGAVVLYTGHLDSAWWCWTTQVVGQ